VSEREFQPCLFCAGDRSEPDHERFCDGRQGGRLEPPVLVDLTPGPVLDSAAARAARDVGIRRVDAHASEDFQTMADHVIETVAHDTPEFTSDDVWKRRAEWPITRDRRALGPAFLRAQRRQIIVDSGAFTRTAQVNSHASPARIWRSLVFLGARAESGQ
jgi:hypothetical protein